MTSTLDMLSVNTTLDPAFFEIPAEGINKFYAHNLWEGALTLLSF